MAKFSEGCGLNADSAPRSGASRRGLGSRRINTAFISSSLYATASTFFICLLHMSAILRTTVTRSICRSSPLLLRSAAESSLRTSQKQYFAPFARCGQIHSGRVEQDSLTSTQQDKATTGSEGLHRGLSHWLLRRNRYRNVQCFRGHCRTKERPDRF